VGSTESVKMGNTSSNRIITYIHNQADFYRQDLKDKHIFVPNIQPIRAETNGVEIIPTAETRKLQINIAAPAMHTPIKLLPASNSLVTPLEHPCCISVLPVLVLKKRTLQAAWIYLDDEPFYSNES